ncbi:MAG: type I DNA topoisomerase, partial [Deltaproteobacteria bacterium]|nr:type I DNA topoisomerase [Deltaproteobacteria bacterium]
AIAWHIAHELGDNKPIQRVLFHEVTKKAIEKALREPLEINENKVNAQQSRRILDRLVGYKISPLLWKTVRRGLSAGRVQSVAVRLVCDREAEIRAFVPVEYWSITAAVEGSQPPPFEARLHQVEGKKAEVGDRESAEKIVAEAGRSEFKVTEVEQKERRRRPTPPFITSKLQQEAARKLGFSAKKTMRVAQQLYEGIELGSGPVGLITYMRTDSVRVADSALAECRECIEKRFGRDYLPAKPNVYKNRNASQDAHEAIRPTSVMNFPEEIEKYLDRDQFRLYNLIWRRFVSSQMSPARYYQTTVSIMAGDKYQFRAVGRRRLFDGFLVLYEEGRDNANGGDENAAETELPPLQKGEILKLNTIVPKQHFTQPPPRFTESTLVKELEERGIGRPSTYAAIMSTIQDRGYVELREKRFYPTDLGELVTELLKRSFPEILDISFTAGMEAELDKIEEGERDWQALLADFYRPFTAQLETALETMRDTKKAGEEVTDEICEKCGANMVVKWGRNGRFLACPNFPECKNTRDLNGNSGENGLEESPVDVGACPECGSPLKLRNGRYGRFISCSNYPECKYTSSVGTGVACPEEGCDGELVEKKSRKGKVFYACNRYPQCKFATWDKPYPMACPQCDYPFLVEKQSRGGGNKILRCPQKNCNYETKLPGLAAESENESKK